MAFGSPALACEGAKIFDYPVAPQKARNSSRCVFRRVAQDFVSCVSPRFFYIFDTCLGAFDGLGIVYKH